MAWDNLLNERLSMSNAVSDCPSMSINPGETTRFRASMIRSAFEPSNFPIFTMRSPRIAMSPETQGFPVPSMILPFLIMTSYALLGFSCANTVKVKERVNNTALMAPILLGILFIDRSILLSRGATLDLSFRLSSPLYELGADLPICVSSHNQGQGL